MILGLKLDHGIFPPNFPGSGNPLDTRKDYLTIAQSDILPENYYSHLVPSEPIVLTILSVVITGKIAQEVISQWHHHQIKRSEQSMNITTSLKKADL